MTALNEKTLADVTRPVEHTRLHIGGEWVDALAGGELETVNPSTGAVFARVAQAEAADVDRAVVAARAAFEAGPWPRMKPRERAAALWRLGGKSANIVFPDANLEKAVSGSTDAIFFNAGQACAAGSRLYVHDSVFDEVVGGLVERARQIRVGDGFDPASQIGPLASREHFDRVNAYDPSMPFGGMKESGWGRETGHEVLHDYTDLKTVCVDIDG
jgi:acyl-CoA reductase-like NAD-dependent aldehyde dehydrogenase